MNAALPGQVWCYGFRMLAFAGVLLADPKYRLRQMLHACQHQPSLHCADCVLLCPAGYSPTSPGYSPGTSPAYSPTSPGNHSWRRRCGNSCDSCNCRSEWALVWHCRLLTNQSGLQPHQSRWAMLPPCLPINALSTVQADIPACCAAYSPTSPAYSPTSPGVQLKFCLKAATH